MAEAPLILFGACDRHNLGDLLFPHIAAALLAPRPCIVAGLAERDLTAHGGHRVAAIARLAAQWPRLYPDRPADLVHVGGELITCSLYEAAIMTLSPEAAQAAIARYDRDENRRQTWAEGELWLRQRVAYLVPKALFPQPGRFLHCALGGVDLPRLPAAMRAEALERLRASDGLTVRDRATQATLAAAGISAELSPDPVVLTAELFGPRIAGLAESGETARVRARFAQGYVAVQFAAEFGDDATLAVLADQLDRIAADTGLGLVLFRAGAAPWHDDAAVYKRLIGRLRGPRVWLFESLDIWDLCALLAQARAYAGSSLHGRIVAACFGVPGVNLVTTLDPPRKQAAYLATWHATEDAGVTTLAGLAQALERAMALPGAAGLAAQRRRVELCLGELHRLYTPLLRTAAADGWPASTAAGGSLDVAQQ
ncbi:MAG: polysaccharide pyruvyl transferase family protein [Thiobacillaceae bacterium]